MLKHSYIEFNEIVSEIVNNKEFSKTKEIKHHGITRYNHSFKIAYYSYLIAKRLNFDYVSTARAGLLHDFFLTENKKNVNGLKCVFSHSKEAAENSKNIFDATEFEQSIIRTHMFPVTVLTVPKSKEGLLVALVDKVVGTWEFFKQFEFTVAVKCVFLFNILLFKSIG